MQALHWPGPRRPCTQCWLRPPGDSRQRKEAERTTPAHCTQPSWYGSTCRGDTAGILSTSAANRLIGEMENHGEGPY